MLIILLICSAVAFALNTTNESTETFVNQSINHPPVFLPFADKSENISPSLESEQLVEADLINTSQNETPVGSSSADTVNPPSEPQNSLIDENLLATVINPSYDKEYTKQFLQRNNNYSGLDYAPLQTDLLSTSMNTKREVGHIKGYRVNEKDFAIEVIACNKNAGGCGFRINGVPTGLFKQSSNDKTYRFQIDDNHFMKVDSITFDYCDNARFCDLEHDAYDLVTISIERIN